MEKSEIILTYIRDELLDDDEEINDDTSLFDARVLDSIQLLSLISFLEASFQLKISTSEVNLDNLDSVEKMLVFLENKS
jgi:acyl carrier protein